MEDPFGFFSQQMQQGQEQKRVTTIRLPFYPVTGASQGPVVKIVLTATGFNSSSLDVSVEGEMANEHEYAEVLKLIRSMLTPA